jgi:excisionase family DNA binding protein
MSDRLLSYIEAAHRLGCSPRTVARRVASGELAAFRDGARIRRIRELDLERYIAQRTSRQPVTAHRASGGAALPPGARLWDGVIAGKLAVSPTRRSG